MLPLSFYQRDDVVLIARELIGKKLFSTIGGELTGGTIIETEAYRGPDDRACHAYNNRRTPRTEVMFHNGGIAYVYLCYGMHNLLNVVTSCQGNPHAVLIRALTPTHGSQTMLRRRKRTPLTNGPGALCQALGITREHNTLPFDKSPLWIENGDPLPPKILATPRIGVEYAKEDALRPWRFVLQPA
ncbi:MAG: DNA-3-methyladenine glycosylase [Candidatus Melainabacteria bacterium]|nr:DNA-3-methyladenine glycosylase [Candidatus Melainabacteria bacterium]